MKNLIIIASYIICTTLISQLDLKEELGAFEFEMETIDYGSIEQNSNGNRLFVFKNIGNAPIIISNVKTSCGCTVVNKPNKPIMPGEIAEIGVTYATNRLGSFSKSITISSNASESIKVLKIKGIIKKANTVILSSID